MNEIDRGPRCDARALDTARVALGRLGLFEDYVRVVLGAVSVLGGRAPHLEGTWPKTLLHKPMGVASTERGGLARRPSSEIDRLAAKGRGI